MNAAFRPGAVHDVKALCETFSYLHFDVKVHSNLTCARMIEVMETGEIMLNVIRKLLLQISYRFVECS